MTFIYIYIIQDWVFKILIFMIKCIYIIYADTYTVNSSVINIYNYLYKYNL